MRTKSLILSLGVLALGMAVSCEDKETLDPAVKIINGATAEISDEGGVHTVTFTSATAWELRGVEEKEWIIADKESGKGSSDEQTITLQIAPNQESDRNASLTIYASPMAKKTITITQKGVKGDGISIAKFLELKDKTNAYKLTGKIGDISTGTIYYGFTLKDETGEISCPFPSNWKDFSSKLHTGDEVTISGTYDFYESKSQDQVKNGSIVSHTPTDISNIQKTTVAQILKSQDRFNMYRYTGTVGGTINAQFASFDLTDESGETIKVYTVNNASEWGSKLKVGGTVQLYGAYTLYTNSNTGVSTPELIDVTIESFTDNGGDTPDPVDKVTVEGLAVAVQQNGFLVSTASDGIKYIYERGKVHGVKVGDNVKVTGSETVYNEVPEITSYEVEVTSSGNTVTYPAATVVTDSNVGSLTLFSYVKVSGKLVHSGNYYNLTVPEVSKTGSIVSPSDIDDATYNKKNVEIEGYYIGDSKSASTEFFNIIYTKITLSADQPEAEDQPGAGSITLTFPDDNKANNSTNDYTSPWVAKTGDTEFDIVNFNNYNWNGWTYIRCGSKNAASAASISTKAAQATAFDKVVLTIDKYTIDNVTSAKLYVASDSEFAAEDLQTVDMVYSQAEGTGTFTIPTPAAGLYYKVEFDCKKSSSNGFVQISKVVLWVNAK